MKMKMKMKVIAIKDISSLRNIRTSIDDSEIANLMTDIKENGLLQPIGVYREGEKEGFILVYGHRRLSALKKLGRKELEIGKEVKVFDTKLDLIDLIVLNTAENLHRVGNSPVEFGMVCKTLKEMGLSVSEIAARLSQPQSKITTALTLAAKVPREYRDSIGYIAQKDIRKKRGKVSATVANTIISNSRLKAKDKLKLFKSAKEQDLSLADINVINQMLYAGASFDEALKKKDTFTRTAISLVVNKEEVTKLNTSITRYVYDVLKGRRKPIKDLVF